MAEYPGSTSRDYRFVKTAPADNAAVTVELPAIAGEHICVQRVDFSYDGDFAGSLIITDGTDEWKVYVTKSGPGPLIGGDAPIYIGAKGVKVDVTLAQPSGDIAGTLNVLYY